MKKIFISIFNFCPLGSPLAFSRETLSAVPPGGNPQERTADAPASLTLR